MNSPSKQQPFLERSQDSPQDLSTSTPPEMSPPNPNQRWQVLFLVCLAAFCHSFFNILLSDALRALLSSQETRGFASFLTKIQFLTWIFPIIFGFLIHYFKIHKTYQFLAGFSALSVYMAVMAIANESTPFKELTLLSATSIGLWVTQIYMIITWFQGKEVALGLGTVFFSDSIASGLYHYLLGNSDSSRGSLYIAVGFCLLIICILLVLSKIEMGVQAKKAITLNESEQIENEKSLLENLKSINKNARMIMGTIFLFHSADFSGYVMAINFVMGMKIDEAPNASNRYMEMISNLHYYLPVLPFLLSGYLADKKGKNLQMMLSAFVVLFIGYTCSYFWQNSSSRVICSAIVLRLFAVCMFQVSSWACLSAEAEKKIFGLILGLAYGLMNLGRLFGGVGNYAITCILGIGLIYWVLVLDEKNQEKLVVDPVLGLDLEKKQEEKVMAINNEEQAK